jgi:hypothetical protein
LGTGLENADELKDRCDYVNSMDIREGRINMSSHWTNRTVVNCTTTLLVAAGLLVACDRENEPMAPTVSPSTEMQLDVADQGGGPILPGPSEHAVATPVALDVDVSELLPATVELAVPMACGDLTVYDQEDVSTLCSPLTLAATPIVSPTCPQVVSGSVRLEVDLNCVNQNGLIVGSDNTVIDLNGHTIRCTGAGYFGSCQGVFTNGIYTNNHRNVHIFSHRPGGTIDGFHHGILVPTNSNNVKVKQLVITGPAGVTGSRRPGFVIGIRVDGVDCDDGIVRLGGGTKTANDISYHNRGIQVLGSTCVLIDQNRIHDNNKNQFFPAGDHALGIAVFSSPNIHLVGSVLTNNGDGFATEGGIALIDATTGTLVNNNQADANLGSGIETTQGASDNYIVNNQMLRNTFRDATSDQSGVNRWNENNRCVTQTTPQPPPGVCGPGEA